MTCMERADLYLLDAVGALSPAESSELQAHLAEGCCVCAGNAAEAASIASQLANLLPEQTPNPQTLQKLMAFTATPPAETIATPPAPAAVAAPPAPLKLYRRPLWPLALSSAIAACIAVAATVFVLSREAQPAPLLATKDLKYVALASTDPNATPHGRIFWDADHHVWHVYVFDLTPPPAGQVYEVWFIDKARGPLPAGTFEVNGIGNGQLILNVPKGMDVTAAAISNEPAGGTEKPTGKVWLQGKIE